MDRGNKERWIEIVNKTGKCSLCPKHGGENSGHKRPRPDKYKNKRS